MSSELLPDNYRVASGYQIDQNTIILSAGQMSTDPLNAGRAIGVYEYYSITFEENQPVVESLPLELPAPGSDDLDHGYGLTDIAANDQFIYGILGTNEGESTSYTLLCIDRNTYAAEWRYAIGTSQYALHDDGIYIYEPSDSDTDIIILELSTGEQTALLNLPVGRLSAQNSFLYEDRSLIYHCNSTGIYLSDCTGSSSTQLAEGSRTSLSADKYTIAGFYMTDKETLLILLEDDSYGYISLMLYEYDETLSLVSDEELVIYSLKENSTIAKMINAYQIANPDISITYNIGMQSDSITTTSEAIKLLNTEILAGNGPDLIVLNGLPEESLLNSGLLEDISDVYSSSGADVYENIFDNYHADGVQYAIPIGIRIPVILGNANYISSFDSISDLADAALADNGTAFTTRGNTELLRHIVSVCWPSVQTNETTISETALADLLSQTKSFNTINVENSFISTYAMAGFYESGEFGDAEEQYYDYFYDNCVLENFDIVYGNVQFDLGYLSSMESYVSICNDGLSVKEFSDNTGTFSALAVAITSNSTQKEAASDFITYLLDDQVQYELLYDDKILPVNRTALRKMFTSPAEEWQEYASLGYNNFTWPGEDHLDELETMILSLKAVAMENYIIMDIVLNSISDYYPTGDRNINEVVQEIKQTLDLYYSER